MTEPAHQPFDFDNMPLTVEQEMLATLKRIEVLLQQQAALTPQPIVQVSPIHASKLPFSKARGK